MNQNNTGHHLQIAFKDKHGAAVANAKYELHKSNGEKVTGVTDSNGKTELLKSDKQDTIAVWISHKIDELVLAGKAIMRPTSQKPEVPARSVAVPKTSQAKTEKSKPTKKEELRKYSVLFNVDGFGCTGSVSYRMVQDGKVLIESKTKGDTTRVYTDSESEVSLYIAGDKRYKKGEAYTPEINNLPGSPDITAWVTAKPNTNHRQVAKEGAFDKHDWVDVSKIYDQFHPDVIPESKGIYAGSWTPPPKPKDRHRHYVVQVDGRNVELFWEAGSCDNGLETYGQKTFSSQNENDWYMTVEQVISRTHPKVFKVLFAVIKELELTYVRISSSWRPGIGSSAHREGRALDITQVKTVAHGETAAQSANARDNLPGSQDVDTDDTPTTTEPALIEKLRIALYNHAEVEQLFDPWYGVFDRKTGFEDSYASHQDVPTSAGLLESDAAFKKRKADKERANSHFKTFAAHRNHMHFHIKLD